MFAQFCTVKPGISFAGPLTRPWLPSQRAKPSVGRGKIYKWGVSKLGVGRDGFLAPFDGPLPLRHVSIRVANAELHTKLRKGSRDLDEALFNFGNVPYFALLR